MELLIKLKRCGFIHQERDILGQSVMYTSLTGNVFYQETQQISHPLMPHNFEETFPAVQDVIQTPDDIYLHDRRNRYHTGEEVYDENHNQDIVTQASARAFNILQWQAPFQILSFHQRLETFQGTSKIFHNPRHLARAGFSYDGQYI
ncbi:inhibitor of apoptosis [Biomphalaria pfeifferi]|uniref:Inhibitor of apoptosis n=1 Tax=Biomphalaria pfeifferi TaxID=112525 RepID=A0AAD8EZ23_BIOPF|nr:inhibitor of apoptosis [Biomphalaria pfeifferi]